jgi:hypothetical protein
MKEEEKPNDTKTMGLWRYNGIAGGKYLIQRRDGSVPNWPSFVLGARDPQAPVALRAYADATEKAGGDPTFVRDVRLLADEFDSYRADHGEGDPMAPPHRKDDPKIIEKMLLGKNA